MEGGRKKNHLSMPALAAWQALLTLLLSVLVVRGGESVLGDACPERADEHSLCCCLLDRADLLPLAVLAVWQA